MKPATHIIVHEGPDERDIPVRGRVQQPANDVRPSRALVAAYAELVRMADDNEMPEDWRIALLFGMAPEDVITMAMAARAARKRAA
jgi:hypothetical protein